MPIDLVQPPNTGSFSATSGNATLPTPTTAGSMVVLCCAILDADATWDWTLEPPTGFLQASGQNFVGAVANRPYIFVKKNTSGESSWLLEPRRESASGNAREVVWAAFELAGTGLDRDGANLGTFPTSAFTSVAQWGMVNTNNEVFGTETAVASRSTTDSDESVCYDNLAFAVWAATSPNTTIPTLSAYTNGFTEVAQVSRVGATRALAMSVAVKPSLSLGALESTASISPSSACYTTLVVLFADGAKYAPDLHALTGFEFGTATAIATGSILVSGVAPFDTVTGTPAVITTSPRTGTYCLELSSTAAAECLTWGSVGPDVMGPLDPTQYFPLTVRFCVYFPTSLPSGDVELASAESGSLANGMVVWYRSASQKLGVVVGTGTEVLSDATVSANQWIGVDVRYDACYANHLVDWAVDYNATPGDATGPVAQTQAVGASTTVAVNPTLFRLGWTTSRTATVRYDDVAVSKLWGCYPLGDLRVTVVEPDQAGTPTISGTATNFKTFTGGPAGTLTTWSATTTRTALAVGPPPVVGPTGVGLLQTAVAASDYCEIPMATFTAAPDNVLRGVRWYTAPCAASTASATLGVKFVDTTGAVVNEIITGHHGLDATTLRWLCKMHRSTASFLGAGFYQITQARMDALKIRIGYSTDATPDVGVYAVFAEVAYAPVESVAVFGQPGGLPRVEEDRDPSSAGIVTLRVYTDTGQTGTLTWYDSAGSPTPVTIAAASNPQVITLNAADVPTVPRLELAID